MRAQPGTLCNGTGFVAGHAGGLAEYLTPLQLPVRVCLFPAAVDLQQQRRCELGEPLREPLISIAGPANLMAPPLVGDLVPGDGVPVLLETLERPRIDSSKAKREVAAADE